jgi:hypothetical protein
MALYENVKLPVASRRGFVKDFAKLWQLSLTSPPDKGGEVNPVNGGAFFRQFTGDSS